MLAGDVLTVTCGAPQAQPRPAVPQPSSPPRAHHGAQGALALPHPRRHDCDDGGGWGPSLPEGPPGKPQAAVLKAGMASRTLSWVCTMEQTRIPGQLGIRTSCNGCRLPRLLGEGHPSHTHMLCLTSEPQSLRPRPGLTQLPLAVRASTEAPEILPASPPWKELAQPGWGLLSALGGGSSSGAPSGLSFRGTGQGEAERGRTRPAPRSLRVGRETDSPERSQALR